MPNSNPKAGCFRSGLPYNRIGCGPRTRVVFQGLLFENKPLTGLLARLVLSAYTLGDAAKSENNFATISSPF